MGMIRIWLDEQEFRDLVRGQVVALSCDLEGSPLRLSEVPVEIVLADIGYARMLDIVRAAIAEGMTPEEFVREQPG